MPISKRQHKVNASKGGKVGGPARAKALTKAKRRDIAMMGAAVKWANWRKKKASLTEGDD